MIDGEKNLIERAIKGEASAFGLLYDRYQPQIYRFVYLKVGLREEADDLTHQVFLQSWGKIREYTFRGFPFSSWLYRIARNEIIDFYRTKKIFLDFETALENSPELRAEEEVVKVVEKNLNIEKVKNAISQLKPLEQDVIILRFIEELSPAEIGLIIDKTPETIRLLQHRAIKNLQKILERFE